MLLLVSIRRSSIDIGAICILPWPSFGLCMRPYFDPQRLGEGVRQAGDLLKHGRHIIDFPLHLAKYDVKRDTWTK